MSFRFLPQLDDFWDEHPEYRECPKSYGSYGIQFGPLAASAVNQSAFCTIDKRADFIATSISAMTTLVGNANYGSNVPITVQLVNMGNATAINDIPLDIVSLAGAQLGATGGPNPIALPECELAWPIIMLANTQCQAIVTNLAAAAVNLWITFDGVNVYARGSDK